MKKQRIRLGWEFFPPGTKAGEESHFEGHPVIDRQGLTSTPNVLQAVHHGCAGTLLGRVEVSGAVTVGVDRMVSTHRKVLWLVEVKDLLREFALRCGERAIKYTHEADPRLQETIDLYRKWRDTDFFKNSEVLATRMEIMELADHRAKTIGEYSPESYAAGVVAWATDLDPLHVRKNVWSAAFCLSVLHPRTGVNVTMLEDKEKAGALWEENMKRIATQLGGMVNAKHRKEVQSGLPKES